MSETGRMLLNEDALNLILHKVVDQATEVGVARSELRHALREKLEMRDRARIAQANVENLERKIDEWVDWAKAVQALWLLPTKATKNIKLPPQPGPADVDIPF